MREAPIMGGERGEAEAWAQVGPGLRTYKDWSRAGWRAHVAAVPDVEAYVEALGDSTIPALAAASAERAPGRVAVSIDGQEITHGGLDADAARVAGWLRRRLEPGEPVLLAAGSSPGFLRCYLGALRAGAVVVLASPAYTGPELAYLVSDSGARLSFADPAPARRLASLPSAPVIMDPAGPPYGRAHETPVRPGDTALLAYTSGTTGRPKCVPLTHRQLLTSIRSAMAAWRWSADDVLAHALPLFHQHGLGGVHATLIAGGTAHLASRFEPAGLVDMARAARASVLFGVPTIYQALLGSAAGSAPALGDLRLAVCGSAPLSPRLAERLAALLGRPPLVRYGTTESGLGISHSLNDSRVGTIGLPLPGVLARVWPRSGHPARPGSDGEIQLRGPQVFDGYRGDPAATQAAFTGDGWFRTGDIGCVDPVTGHMVMRGRIKEMIITGGLNVYPREVETVLETHPCIAEAAVAGIPDERWGEQVTAWVVMRPGCRFAEDELVAHARAAMAAYKCPKRVFQLAALPRNHLGKVLREELARGLPLG